MPSARSSLEKITALLNEIAMEKQARDECHADVSASVEKGKATGATTKQDDEIIRSSYGPNQPTYAESVSGGGVPRRDRELYGTYTGQSPSDENPSKLIKNYEVDPAKYLRKRASDISDTELLQDIAVLGNSLLYDVISRVNGQATQKTAEAPQQAQQAPPPPVVLDVERKDDLQNVKVAGDAQQPTQPSEEEQIGLATGVCLGLQKQAEYHADLVARYLYGNLATKLAAAKKAADEENAEEETENQPPVAPSDSDKSEPEDEEEDKKKVPEKDEDKEKDTTGKSDSGAVDKEPPVKLDAENGEDLSQADATQALQDMAQTSQGGENVEGKLTEEELLNLIASVLPEMGGIQALQQAGPQGAKLASAVDNHIRSGKFKIPSFVNPRIKRASDFVKDYIYDLLQKTKRR